MDLQHHCWARTDNYNNNYSQTEQSRDTTILNKLSTYIRIILNVTDLWTVTPCETACRIRVEVYIIHAISPIVISAVKNCNMFTRQQNNYYGALTGGIIELDIANYLCRL